VRGAVEQLTVKTQSGVRTRLDVVGKDAAGNFIVAEGKASNAARLTKNQKKAFPEIEQSGATVVGRGKGAFPGGTKIPPTKVQVVRPNELDRFNAQ
jgi:filamentous hemagglutinin